MKTIKQIIMSLAMVFAASMMLAPITVSAQTLADDIYDTCESEANADSAVCAGREGQAEDVITPVINTLLFLIGTIAVIMIIVGGIRYTLSAGDTSNVAAAKNTILYAVIGLIIAILSFAIVNFVIDQF